MDNNKLIELKEKLNRAIEESGTSSTIVLKLSQELDILIVEEMNKTRNDKNE